MKAGRKPANGTKTVSAQVQSLTRGLALLERLSAADHGLTLTDLAARLDLAPSTAHRLLNSMLQDGFVAFDERQGLWSVGLKAFSVGNAYLRKRNLAALAHPLMQDLVRQTGETSNLAILQPDCIVFVAQVESKEVMRMAVPLGSRGPLHATGVGKALLSALPEPQALERVAMVGMPSLTEKTLTSLDALAAEMQKIRRNGFAVDNEEQKPGLRCLAANIYGPDGQAVAAVSLSGPVIRVSDAKIPEFSAYVTAAARHITEAYGGSEKNCLRADCES